MRGLPLSEIFTLTWSFHPIATLALVLFATMYGIGYSALRKSEMDVDLGSRHIVSFAVGFLFLAVAALSPLTSLKSEYLFARSLQQVLVAILAPPLLWYGQFLPCLVTALPSGIQSTVHRVWRRSAALRSTLRFLTAPGVVWLATLGLFGLWHDSTIVDWIMPVAWASNAFLWVYCATFLLFWWHAMGLPPHLHTPLPMWIRFLYLIVGGEIANMITGVSLAFRAEPVFAYYANQTGSLGITALQDQMISGGIIWVTGSFVYVAFAVALMGQALFLHRKPPGVPPRDWQTATIWTIAPGLEPRVEPRRSLDS